MGSSSSSTYSDSVANASIAQDYSGSCSITCNNQISDVTIDIINSNVQGGINFSQECTVDGQCLFSTTMSATADLFQKASNSSNAKDADASWLTPPNITSSSSESRQEINESIIQTTNQSCNAQTVNDIDNVNIVAENSQISGGINIGQVGTSTASCTMNAAFTALASGSQYATNTAESGKDKKGEKKGDKGSFMQSLTTLLIVLGILIVVVVTVKIIFPDKLKCAAGLNPIPDPRDKHGKKMMCPCPDGSTPLQDEKNPNIMRCKAIQIPVKN